MALPPSIFIGMQDGLKRNCYSERGTSRIIVSREFNLLIEHNLKYPTHGCERYFPQIEKPFSHDLESSRELPTASLGFQLEGR